MTILGIIIAIILFAVGMVEAYVMDEENFRIDQAKGLGYLMASTIVAIITIFYWASTL